MFRYLASTVHPNTFLHMRSSKILAGVFAITATCSFVEGSGDLDSIFAADGIATTHFAHGGYDREQAGTNTRDTPLLAPVIPCGP